MTDRQHPALAPVLGLFLLSGATGLVYEVLWSARLGRVFGHAAQAAAATLLAFFLGLAAGAWAWGRLASRLRRPLRAYGWLEIGVAVAAGAALALDPLHRALYRVVVGAVGVDGTALTVARLVLAVLLLGPAAFLMGGTLPVLGTYVVRRRETLGRRASLLYAVNTVGAAGGALLGGFVLPPLLGYRTSYLAGMTATLLVGALALLLARREPGEAPARAPVDPAPAADATTPAWPTLVSLAFASGFLALALQVLWTRLFAHVLQNSVQTFATILAVYLLALGLAGGLAHVLARRTGSTRTVLALLLGAAGALVALSGLLYLTATSEGRVAPGVSWPGYVARAAGLVALVVGPAIVGFGAVFPYLWRVAERVPRPPGVVLGTLAAWNTVGAALGAVLAGFVLLPAAGAWLSLRLIAVAYAAIALWIALRGRARLPQAIAFTVVVATASAVWPLPAVARPRAGEWLLQAWEGPSGTVAVFRRDDVIKLRFNDVFTLGGSEDCRWERIQAHVALGLHPQPRSVFFLGMGTGVTAGGAMAHDLDRVVVAEIVPEVAEAARLWFAPETQGLFEPGAATIVEDDARHRLAWGRATYDVIMGDLFFPWEAGAADLFTREHFEAVKARLEPGGVFVQWLPCYQLSLRELGSIANTVAEVFPLATLWRGDFLSARPIVAVAGHADAAPLDPDALVARARALAGRDTSGYGDHPTVMPFAFYAGNLTAGRRLVAAEPLQTDDRPWLAWDAPREKRRREAGEAHAATGDALLGFEERLAEATPPDADPYLARLTPAQRRRVRAGLVLRRLSVHGSGLRARAEREALKAWILLVPAAERPPLEAWIR